MYYKLFIDVLGCPKNWVDSEHLLGQLKNFSLTSEPEEADIIIINTCSFILPSREESIDTILQLAELKKTAKCKKLIVSGCLVESHNTELQQELPEVDFYHTVENTKELIEFLQLDDADKEPINPQVPDRFLLKEIPSNYLKIAEGCNHRCSFCTIPLFKGNVKSRSLDDLVIEAEQMVNRGVYEINLVAQDITSYGMDQGNYNLVDLLRQLVNIKEIKWIRLLYLYPTLISDELIDIVKQEDKICRYFDIPFQHLDDRILKPMGRVGSIEQYWQLIQKIRAEIDEVVIRTALILGFPGETDDIFQNLLKEMERFRFNNLGIFQYSPEEATKSYSLPDHVSDEIKESRYKQAMQLQAQISAQLLESRRNKVYDTLIEEMIPGEDEDLNYYIGRTEFEAPEVDGNIVISSLFPLKIGQWYPVKIMSSSEYDLYGIINE